MSTTTFLKRGAIVGASVLISLSVMAGTANAKPGVPSIGDGRANDTHSVFCLQYMLNKWNVRGVLATDGIWGPLTRGRVQEFQDNLRLDSDGVVGPQTGQALYDSVKGAFLDRTVTSCYAYIPTLY